MAVHPEIKTELANEAPGLPFPAPAMPWQVPVGYFEQLSVTVLERIRLESDELPAILRTLQENNAQQPGWPYQTPAGYFEKPPASITTIQSQSTAQGSSPIVSLYKRSFLKYAVAAAVLFAIVGIGRWYQQHSLPDIDADPTSWVRNEVKKESTEKIEHYVEGNLIEMTDLSTDHKNEIAMLTKDIDEKEILRLLDETSLLASSSNVSADQSKTLN